MNNDIRTLIAVAIIDRTGEATVASLTKQTHRVREDVAALTDLVVILDTAGVATAAVDIAWAEVMEDGTIRFRRNGKDSAAKLVGIDFSEIVGTSPNPIRTLEIDVDGADNLVGAEVLTAGTIKAAKAALVPQPKHLCGAPAFYGPCRVPVAVEGEPCASHRGHLCGATTTYGTTCRMTVAKKGATCALHAAQAPAARKGRKAAA